jgi:hypothetical protein
MHALCSIVVFLCAHTSIRHREGARNQVLAATWTVGIFRCQAHGRCLKHVRSSVGLGIGSERRKNVVVEARERIETTVDLIGRTHMGASGLI